MQQTTIKMQSRGVLTLPKKIREKAGLSSGSLIDIEVSDGQVTMRAVSRLDRELAKAVSDAVDDIREGRATPVFSSIKEFDAYMKQKKARGHIKRT